MKRCIVVTGASRGIGRALVNVLIDRGEYVISISRGSGLSAKHDEGELRLEFDWASFDRLPTFLREELGDLCVKGVVNNAGILRRSPLLEAEYEDFIEHMKVNVWLPLELFKTLYREKLFTLDAHVLNIGSMGGIQGASKFPGLFNYSSSKAALASLTEAMAAEFRGEGLCFNYLALGAVNTEMLKTAFPGYFAEVNPENMAKWIACVLLDSGGIMNGRLIEATNSDPEA